MNGLGIEDTLAKSFAPGKIFGGMAFTCNNRVEGVVKHLKYGALLVGHNGDDPAELAAVEQLFANANVKLSTSPCLLESRWEKLCWNMPFNGLACAMGGITTDRIVGDPDLRAQALAVMEEVVEMGQRDLSARALDGTGALGQPLIERMFALTDRCDGLNGSNARGAVPRCVRA
jgi:2-dehydropantoate 2-reductase